MGSLRDRLVWDGAGGTLFDGPRRYLMMRPDVLMGTLATLDGPAQQAWLDAWAAATQRHGGASLRSYAEAVDFEARPLMVATAQAAADLGWGAWQLTLDPSALRLTVSGSPFVDGWRAASPHPASAALCAPVRGMLQALAGLVLPGGPIEVDEPACAATQPAHMPCICRFIARVSA